MTTRYIFKYFSFTLWITVYLFITKYGGIFHIGHMSDFLYHLNLRKSLYYRTRQWRGPLKGRGFINFVWDKFDKEQYFDG